MYVYEYDAQWASKVPVRCRRRYVGGVVVKLRGVHKLKRGETERVVGSLTWLGMDSGAAYARSRFLVDRPWTDKFQ
jgi:hypothetical protein